MEDTKYKLYSLSDETGVRYIGITKQKLSTRLSGHISSCKQAFKNKKSRHYRHCWIKSLLDREYSDLSKEEVSQSFHYLLSDKIFNSKIFR
jgi:predicted GIY-YIG superfamily endonuclease